MISPFAAYTPTRQPAGTKDKWMGLDDYSTYDGSTWRDVIEDVNGETWQRIRRNIGDDPPWHPIVLPGHKKAVPINLEPLKDSIRRHQQGRWQGIMLQVETVAALITEIERLRTLVAEMQACIAEALNSAEEACNV